MRRLALVAAAVLAVSIAPHAQAEDAFPAPTVGVTVITTVGGVPLTKGLVKAVWNVNVPGKNAELNTTAYEVPGTTTTITALFTSRDVKVYEGIPAFVEDIGSSHSGLGLGNASISWSLRWRPAGGTYNRWFTIVTPYGPALDGESRHIPVFFPHDLKRTMQFQVSMKLVLADGGEDRTHFGFRANN